VLEELGCDTHVRNENSEDGDGEYEFSYWKSVGRDPERFCASADCSAEESDEDDASLQDWEEEWETEQNVQYHLDKFERLGNHSNW